MNFPGHDRKARHMNLPGQTAHSVPAESDDGPEEAESDARPIRAVVLEESPMMLKTLSSILQERDDVQLIGTATDGHHALRRVVELAPDLVLVDLNLPGMNGLEATRQIKARSQRRQSSWSRRTTLRKVARLRAPPAPTALSACGTRSLSCARLSEGSSPANALSCARHRE